MRQVRDCLGHTLTLRVLKVSVRGSDLQGIRLEATVSQTYLQKCIQKWLCLNLETGMFTKRSSGFATPRKVAAWLALKQ